MSATVLAVPAFLKTGVTDLSKMELKVLSVVSCF